MPPKQIDELVNAVHNHTTQCLNLIYNPAEKAKLEMNAAKTEAAFKGFVLPISLTAGGVDELDNKGFKKVNI